MRPSLTKQAIRARNTLWNEIFSGRVRRERTCENCGFAPRDNSLIHAHHDDYSKPLDVRWLCGSCHKRHHLGLPMIGDFRRGMKGVDLNWETAPNQRSPA